MLNQIGMDSERDFAPVDMKWLGNLHYQSLIPVLSTARVSFKGCLLLFLFGSNEEPSWQKMANIFHSRVVNIYQ